MNGHYITGLDRNGNQLSASGVYNNISPAGPKLWREVGVHVDHAWTCAATPTAASSIGRTLADSARGIADVDGDGIPELIR